MNVLKSVPYYRVSDLDGQLKYYADTLGYEIENQLVDDSGVFWAWLSNGDSAIMFSNRPVHGYCELTWLYVENADAVWDKMQHNGVEIIKPIANQTHGTREFVIRDPSGQVLVISHLLKKPEESGQD